MKHIFILSVLLSLAGCQKNEAVSEFTGTQATYALVAGSAYNVNGTATFKERKDGTSKVLIALTGIDGNSKFPVHLHLGDLSTADADVALLLSPVEAANGKSETIVSQLANETKITYKELIQLAACVKIHLAESGPGRSVILAAGNIGANSTNLAAGRVGIGLCKSN